MPEEKSATEFEKLLTLLNADDRDRAGVAYEALRTRLIRFFDWRGCLDADDLADEVFERIIRKIGEGEEIQNVAAFAARIAQFVYKEQLRRPIHVGDGLELLAETVAVEDPQKTDEKERIARCLEHCLGGFDEATRQLVVGYYTTDQKTLIDARKKLADEAGISLNTLRIRVCRQKSKLEECVRSCCAG